MNRKFAYRIPVVYRVFFMAVFGYLLLAEHGFFPDSMPSGDFIAPLFTIAFLLAAPLLIFSPYRNSYIELRDDHLLLPSLFIPPFSKRVIPYSDIVSIDEVTDDNGYNKMTLRLRSGTVKISSHYCYDKNILTWGSPDEYIDLYFDLRERVPEYAIS